MSKTIPAEGRVQVVTQDMLDADAMTIRAEESGPDVRVYSSEDQEGSGFPLRADDEFAIAEEEGFGSLNNADGLWMETATSESTEVIVLKGVAIRRNVRRDVTTTVTSVVETNNYLDGQGINDDGTGYPITVDPTWTIQEIDLLDVGDINMVVTTTDGSTFTVPLSSRIGSFDHWAVDSVTFEDPNGNNHPLKGAVAGGSSE